MFWLIKVLFFLQIFKPFAPDFEIGNQDDEITCQIFLPQIRKQFHIDDGSDDPLQRPELRVYPQREQHQEEQHRPELRTRELIDGLREDYEGEAGAWGGLEDNGKLVNVPNSIIFK